jgi:hypothetical protein
MKNKCELNIGFKLLVLLLCMASFGAWFLQNVGGWLFSFACGVLLLLVSASRHYFKMSKQNTTWFLLLVIATLFTCVHMNFNGYLAALIGLFPLYMIFCLKYEYKENLLHFLKKAFGWMILISLVWYLVFLSGIPLPNFEMVRESSDTDMPFHYSVFYLFTLKTDGDLLSMLLPRFEFVFYEPGYFGCMVAVLLYINGFVFDREHWENFVFLPSLILSFSLSGIAIGMIGFISYSIKNSRHKMRWLLLTAVLFGGFYFAVTKYNQGDNLFYKALFARLEYDDSRGGVVGNTRFSEYVSDFFWSKFIHGQDVWFGMKDSDRVLTNNNVDYLSFTIRYGIFALLSLLVFLYYPVMRDKRNRYDSFCLAIIYTLIFAQGSFSVFWTLNIVLLILGINNIQQVGIIAHTQVIRNNENK